MNLLEIKNLSLDFEIDDVFYPTIKDVSFDLKKNSIHAIIGESGSGKTMSVMSIIKLLPKNAKITSGEILFDNISSDFASISPKRSVIWFCHRQTFPWIT